LDKQIDTPRLYRLEQLPRALPWLTVIELLKSLDVTSDIGLRDFAMFLLIATYGLRASEVVELTLDDVAWRKGVLHIHQRKTSSSLELPLTNEVATALTKHLKRSAPPAPYRRIFLRKRAPIGVLKPTAVTEAFRPWCGTATWRFAVVFQITAYEAVIVGFQFECRRTGVVHAGHPVLLGERQHALNAAHRHFSLTAMHELAE
jgi:integrase